MLNPFRALFKAGQAGVSVVSTWAQTATWSLSHHYPRLVAEGYRKNAVAYACIRLLAQSVPEPPLTVSAIGRDGLTQLAAHPLRTLIETPNPYMTEFEFWELVTTHLSIAGRSCWWKERGRGGGVIALWPLRPDRIAPKLGMAPLLQGWVYTLDTDARTLPPEDVLSFNYPDPGGETGGIIEGLGPLQVLAREVDADNEATSFTKALLENYAIPGVVIQTKAKLTREMAQQVREGFRRQYGGARRGEPAVIDADATVTPISHTLGDLAFPDLRALSESRIAAAFGVPPILAGLKVGLDRSTFSNMAEARQFWTETTLSVLWRRLADQVQSDLVPEFARPGQIVVTFDTSVVKALQGLHNERAARYAEAYKAAAITRDEYRQHALHLPPIDGANVFVAPLNLVTSQPGLAAIAPPARSRVIDVPAKRLLSAGRKALTLPAGWHETVQREVSGLAVPVERRLNAMWRQMGVDVLASPALKSVQRKDGLPDDAADLLPADTSERITEALAPGWDAAVTAGADAAKGLLGAFDLPMAEVQRVLDQLATRVTGITDTTREDIRRVVGDALQNGASIPDLQVALKGLFEETYKGRSESIARTESGNAYNAGSVLAYRESGLVSQVLVLDGNQDEACAAVAGSHQTLEWAASNLLAHPRCTRAMAPVVE